MTKSVAIVTAASRGMGAACARELSRRGYDLALMARSDDVNALAAELGAVAVTGTVTSESDLQGLVGAALARYGRIDAVVNNTGHAPKGELLELPDEDWRAGFDLLFLNVVRMARLVTPTLLARRRRSIGNVSTFGAVEPSLKFPVSSSARRPGGVRQDVRPAVRRRRPAHEQRIAGLHRHVPSRRGDPGRHPGREARHGGGSGAGGRVPCFGRVELRHRAEPPRGRRPGAWNVRRMLTWFGGGGFRVRPFNATTEK